MNSPEHEMGRAAYHQAKRIAINVVKAIITGIMMICVGIIVAIALARVTCQTMWTVVRGRKEKATEVTSDNYCKVCYETRRLEWRAVGNYDVVNQILLLEPCPDCPICNGTGIVKVIDRQETVKRNGG